MRIYVYPRLHRIGQMTLWPTGELRTSHTQRTKKSSAARPHSELMIGRNGGHRGGGQRKYISNIARTVSIVI